MYDEQQLEETQSAHSIGIVENPLYVEEEGTFSSREVIPRYVPILSIILLILYL